MHRGNWHLLGLSESLLMKYRAVLSPLVHRNLDFSFGSAPFHFIPKENKFKISRISQPVTNEDLYCGGLGKLSHPTQALPLTAR